MNLSDLRSVNRVPDSSFVAGVVLADGVAVSPSPEGLKSLMAALVQRRSGEEFPSAVKEAVRSLLKRGGFKPSGRNKPASEYLAQAAREGRFPFINNLVDVNNLLSLETGLPISLLDLRSFGTGSGTAPAAVLRYGTAGEKYVFNPAGQEIDLEGLLCVGSERALLGNPVKDSMAGKLKDDTRAVLGVIYGTLDCEPGRGMAAHVERFAALLKEFGGAGETKTSVLRLGP